MTATPAAADQRLYAYPAQIVRTPEGAVVRRGPVRLQVRGDRARDILIEIVQAASRPNGTRRDEVLGRFDAELHPALDDLLDTLLARRILVTLTEGGEDFLARGSAEEREDVFYWTFVTERAEVEREASARRIVVVGINAVSHALVPALRAAAFRHVVAVDHPLLRATRFFREDGAVDRNVWSLEQPLDHGAWADAGDLPDCIVATTDFGGLSLMREWNAFCVQSGTAFYPVVLQDMVGFAGPLVLPGRTACFECFWLRQNSNLESAGSRRETEEAAFHGQLVDGLTAAMPAVLGHVAAFELFRFFAMSRLAGFEPNTVTDVDLIGGAMTRRRLLRAPRCPVCGAGRRHARVAVERDEDAPLNLIQT